MISLTKTIAPMALTLLLAAPSFSSPVTQTWVVNGDGFGPVRYGMKLEDAEQALGLTLDKDESDGCGMHPLPGDLHGVLFLHENGVIRVVYVDGGPTATDLGTKIGDSEQQVLDLYKGRVRVEPSKYGEREDQHDLNVIGVDGKVQMVVQTERGKVIGYKAGREPQVNYVEACG